LLADPVDLVELSLNKHQIDQSDELVLSIRNLGFQRVSFGTSYRIYKVFSDGTTEEVEFPPNYAFSLLEIWLAPLFGSYQQDVYTGHLKIGVYLVEKEITIGEITYSKSVKFIVLLARA